MSAEEATLFAAVIAAGASVLTLLLGIFGRYRSELRAAQRVALEAVVVDLASLLYEVVAISKAFLGTTSEEKLADLRAQLAEKSAKLDDLRKRTRYSLWGLNDAIHLLLWLPRWVEHVSDDRARSEKLIGRATELRISLDRAIQRSYRSGLPPRWYDRMRCQARARKLKDYWDRSGRVDRSHPKP